MINILRVWWSSESVKQRCRTIDDVLVRSKLRSSRIAKPTLNGFRLPRRLSIDDPLDRSFFLNQSINHYHKMPTFISVWWCYTIRSLVQHMHAMIIRHVYTYWWRFLIWIRNCRLCSWISRRSYKSCLVATIPWRNSVRAEIVPIHSSFHRLTSNFERLMQRSQMMMQNEHDDSRQMQIKRSNECADCQHEMLD
jgi:hypothetical protein